MSSDDRDIRLISQQAAAAKQRARDYLEHAYDSTDDKLVEDLWIQLSLTANKESNLLEELAGYEQSKRPPRNR